MYNGKTKTETGFQTRAMGPDPVLTNWQCLKCTDVKRTQPNNQHFSN